MQRKDRSWGKLWDAAKQENANPVAKFMLSAHDAILGQGLTCVVAIPLSWNISINGLTSNICESVFIFLAITQKLATIATCKFIFLKIQLCFKIDYSQIIPNES